MKSIHVEKQQVIRVEGATEHNLKHIDIEIPRRKITVVTGVSGSGKSSLVFDTILAEAQRRFFYTLSQYSRQFLDIGARPAVRRVVGLSPAIALAQNETMPSSRATVGTLTDVSELIAVGFARFGVEHCPDHSLPTAPQSVAAVAERILREYDGQNVAICAPIADAKKGAFKAQLQAVAEKGFLRAWIDGKVVSLSPPPTLPREEKHTIKILVDVIKVRTTASERIVRSIETAWREGNGFGEFMIAETRQDQIELVPAARFSTVGGCPTCGYSWPKLDSRYFNANSLGRCSSCDGYGIADPENSENDAEDFAEDAVATAICRDCQGMGIDSKYNAIKLAGYSISDLLRCDLNELLSIAQQLHAKAQVANELAQIRLFSEIVGILQRVVNTGIGYLNAARRVRTLSFGELQRLKLSGVMTDSLHGVLYILDEPSQGLHPKELDALCSQLESLRDAGNTVIVVDHDEALMQRADLIVDLGPGGGTRGGSLMAKFAPRDAAKFAHCSATARFLAAHRGTAKDKLVQKPPRSQAIPKNFLRLIDPSLNNLRPGVVQIPLNHLSVIAGVSGSGKSTLAMEVLAANAKMQVVSRGKSFKWLGCQSIDGLAEISAVQIVDRRPVAKSSVSIPASYLDVLGEIRNLYAALPSAQIAGLTARAFSLNAEGGRCETCKGRGEINLTMRFLADARVRCDDCQGRRFKPIIDEILYNGKTVADVFEMTIDDALVHFAHHRKIVNRLRPAEQLGLGYLKLGQPSSSLSGGESQRLKMVPFLASSQGQRATGTLLILDEPTTGLHADDVRKLISCLRAIVEAGATIVVVEHHIDVIRSADWLIELGPGAAMAGGQTLFQGAPGELSDKARRKHSVIAPYLFPE